MTDTQGRGDYYDESRIERAAQRAHENGGTDDAIERAAEEFFSSTTNELIRRIREKMQRLFGR